MAGDLESLSETLHAELVKLRKINEDLAMNEAARNTLVAAKQSQQDVVLGIRGQIKAALDA